MSKKEKKQLTVSSMSPTKLRISKQQKGDSPTQKFPPEFITQLKTPDFRGVWIFGDNRDYVDWMMTHSKNLLKEYHGAYNVSNKRWSFPTGWLALRVLETAHDLEFFRGQRFNYIGVSGTINPEIQQAVLDFLAINFRKL